MKLSLFARIIALSLATLAPVFTTGCTATKQAVSSVRGEVKGLVSASLDEAFHAANKAVTEMRFQKMHAACDVLSGLITCTTAEGTKVEIRLTKETDKIVTVFIQVGKFGDDRVATALLEKIRQQF